MVSRSNRSMTRELKLVAWASFYKNFSFCVRVVPGLNHQSGEEGSYTASSWIENRGSTINNRTWARFCDELGQERPCPIPGWPVQDPITHCGLKDLFCTHRACKDFSSFIKHLNQQLPLAIASVLHASLPIRPQQPVIWCLGRWRTLLRNRFTCMAATCPNSQRSSVVWFQFPPFWRDFEAFQLSFRLELITRSFLNLPRGDSMDFSI